MAWIELCKVSDLKNGEGKFVDIGGRQLAVFMNDGKPHVVDDYCPHAGGSLAGGFLEDGCVVCSWHYWAFDLSTGNVTPNGRAHVGVYPARLNKVAKSVEADLPNL